MSDPVMDDVVRGGLVWYWDMDGRPMSVFWRHSIRRYLEERGLPPLRRKYR